MPNQERQSMSSPMGYLLDDMQWAARYGAVQHMSKGEFWIAYFRHRSIMIYAVIAVTAGAAAALTATSFWQILVAALLVVFLYPPLEYIAHKYILHSRAFYKHEWSSRLWRRLHYDHHMDPGDFTVLFGDHKLVSPPLALFSFTVGWLSAGLAGGFAGIAFGFLSFMMFEFFHCAAHLPVRFSGSLMRSARRHHQLHHFHNETHNFGVATDVCDQLVGTNNAVPGQVQKSATRRNLGYTKAEAERYPWIWRQYEQRNKAH